MADLTFLSADTEKRIAQYDIYYNQYNLSRNQIKHVEQMHLVTVINSILISPHFNIVLCSMFFFSSSSSSRLQFMFQQFMDFLECYCVLLYLLLCRIKSLKSSIKDSSACVRKTVYVSWNYYLYFLSFFSLYAARQTYCKLVSYWYSLCKYFLGNIPKTWQMYVPVCSSFESISISSYN